MIRREVFLCIRFSKEGSSKITDKSLKVLTDKLEKQFVKPIKTALSKADKKVKVWVEQH